MARHTDKVFESELKGVRSKLLTLGELVQKAIAEAVRALTERNDALADEVIDGDRQVNRLEVEIDELCFRILALRQPAASDLRFITLALKVVTDLERIGDLAVNVAESAKRLNALPPLASLDDLPRMAELAQHMLARVLDAFVDGDAVAAREVLHSDEEVDELYHQRFRRLVSSVKKQPDLAERTMHVLLATRHLERIGDHATNVAEMVIFYVEGRDVRHPGKS